MKSTISALTRPLVMLCLLLLAATPSLAQETETRIKEGQEYKIKFNEALDFARAKQYQQAYAAFKEAMPLAEAAGDQEVVRRGSEIMAKLDNSWGTAEYKRGNFEAAITHHDNGIANLESYPNNYYGKAKALQKLERWDEALPILQTVSEMSDVKSSRAAIKTVLDHYTYQASSALTGGSGGPTAAGAREALTQLDAIPEWVSPDSDVFYYRAVANQTLSEYDAAIEQANLALESHRGSRSAKAKIYFVLGESFMYSGATQDAIEAFRNASFGEYKPLAEHYLEELTSGQ